MNYTLSEVVESNLTFLDYLKTRTELYHQSNVFFRDFQYGIMEYGKSKCKKISYGRAEQLARELVSTLEQTGLLRRITPGSWMLNYPQFRKPSSKSEAASKPSSGPAVAKIAIATPSSGLASPSSSGTMTPS
jgi:hypothetical protein